MAHILLRTEAGTITAPAGKTRRRRLDRIVASQNIPPHYPFFVEVDAVCYGRDEWKNHRVQPRSTVEIVFVLEGGAGGGGGQSTGKAIGSALALLALSITAPFVAGGLAGALGFGGSALATGVIGTLYTVGGALVVNQALGSKGSQVGQNSPPKIYGVSGGGNQGREYDPIPIPYGKVWLTPDLAQHDFIGYEGDQPVLYKRLVIGPGTFDKHSIRIGNTLLWQEGQGVSTAFPGVDIEWLEPGQASQLVPLNIITSSEVSGLQLPASQVFVGPFVASRPRVNISKIMLDFSFPSGAYSQDSSGRFRPVATRLNAEIQTINDDGQPISGWNSLFDETFTLSAATPRHFTREFTVAPARYQVRFRRLSPVASNGSGEVTWDQLRAGLPDMAVRQGVTELAMRIKAGPNLSQTAFSNVEARVTKRVRIWNGIAWSAPAPSSNPAWIVADLLTNSDYGGGRSQSRLDLSAFLFYANLWAARGDEFNSIIRGPVSLLEACQTVLMAGRAQLLPLGSLWSIIRDEAKATPKFIFSGRSMIAGTPGIDFVMSPAANTGNLTVQYFEEADPKRPAEVTIRLGDPTQKPRAMALEGVTSHAQAWREGIVHATADLLRRKVATFTVGFDGRLIARGDPCRVEMPLDPDATARGVIARAGYALELDSDVNVSAFTTATLRDRGGKEWGPIAISQGSDARHIALNTQDVSYVSGITGKTLDDVVVTDNGNLPTVLFGVLEPFTVVSARPISLSQVEITAINDPLEIHQADGSTAPPQIIPPSRAGAVTELVLGAFAANTTLQGKAVVLEWSFAPVAGAARYWVEISYDQGASLQTLGDSANLSGSAIIRPVNCVVYGRAVSTFGVASNTITQIILAGQFSETINSVAPAALSWERADASFQTLLSADKTRRVTRELDTVFADLNKLAEESRQGNIALLTSDSLAGEEAKRSSDQALATTVVKTQVDMLAAQVADPVTGLPATFAQITEERRVRSSLFAASAQTASALDVRVTAHDSDFVTVRGQISDQSLVSAMANTVAVQRLSVLEGQVSSPLTGLQATSARVTEEERLRTNDVMAVAQRATNLETTVNNSTTGLLATRGTFSQQITTLNDMTSALSSQSNNLSAEVAAARQGLPSLSAQLSSIQTAQANGDSALSGRVDTATARSNFGTANGEVGFTVASGIGGVIAAYRVMLRAGQYSSGFRVGVASDGSSEVVIDAGVLRSGNNDWVLRADGTTSLTLRGANSSIVIDDGR